MPLKLSETDHFVFFQQNQTNVMTTLSATTSLTIIIVTYVLEIMSLVVADVARLITTLQRMASLMKQRISMGATDLGEWGGGGGGGTDLEGM